MLGHGDEQRQPLPKKVETLEGRRVVAVSAGFSHSLANTANGAVFTWGKGDHACLGHGEDVSNQLLPKKIEAWAVWGSEVSERKGRTSCLLYIYMIVCQHAPQSAPRRACRLGTWSTCMECIVIVHIWRGLCGGRAGDWVPWDTGDFISLSRKVKRQK